MSHDETKCGFNCKDLLPCDQCDGYIGGKHGETCPRGLAERMTVAFDGGDRASDATNCGCVCSCCLSVNGSHIGLCVYDCKLRTRETEPRPNDDRDLCGECSTMGAGDFCPVHGPWKRSSDAKDYAEGDDVFVRAIVTTVLPQWHEDEDVGHGVCVRFPDGIINGEPARGWFRAEKLTSGIQSRVAAQGQKPKLHEPRAASGAPPATEDDTRRTDEGDGRSVPFGAKRSGDRSPLGASASFPDRVSETAIPGGVTCAGCGDFHLCHATLADLTKGVPQRPITERERAVFDDARGATYVDGPRRPTAAADPDLPCAICQEAICECPRRPTATDYQEMQRNFVEADTIARQLRAEVDMLRGVDCEADGDGPCGACIKCAIAGRHVEQRRERAQALPIPDELLLASGDLGIAALHWVEAREEERSHRGLAPTKVWQKRRDCEARLIMAVRKFAQIKPEGT